MPAPKDRHSACVNHHPRGWTVPRGRILARWCRASANPTLHITSFRSRTSYGSERIGASVAQLSCHSVRDCWLASGSAQLPLGAGLLVGEWLGSRPPLGAALGEAPLSGGKPSWCSPASRTGSTPARAPSGLTGTSGWRPLPWIQTLSGVSQRATVRWMPPKLLESGSHLTVARWLTPDKV